MKRWPYVVGGIAFVIFVMTACAPPGPPPPPGNNPAIVGDSIVYGAQLQGSMSAAVPNAFIDADPGRGVRQPGLITHRDAWVVIPPAISHLTPGGWLVLEIGTNDLPIADTFGTDIYPTKIADMLTQVPANVCVAFVEVADWSTFQRIVQSRAWNAALQAAANTRACGRIVPWYEHTRLRTAQILGPDHIHPNAQGNNELAMLIAASTR